MCANPKLLLTTPNQLMNCTPNEGYIDMHSETIPTSLYYIYSIILELPIKFGYHTSSQNINIKLRKYLTILY